MSTPKQAKMQNELKPRMDDYAPMTKAIALVSDVIVIEGPASPSAFLMRTCAGSFMSVWSTEFAMTNISSTPMAMSKKLIS